MTSPSRNTQRISWLALLSALLVFPNCYKSLPKDEGVGQDASGDTRSAVDAKPAQVDTSTSAADANVDVPIPNGDAAGYDGGLGGGAGTDSTAAGGASGGKDVTSVNTSAGAGGGTGGAVGGAAGGSGTGSSTSELAGASGGGSQNSGGLNASGGGAGSSATGAGGTRTGGTATGGTASGGTTTGGQTGCVAATDCPGPCATCGADHACTTVKGMDDATGRCTGTCDATGVCKSKQGQACQATAGGCVSGTVCADGYCCNRACTGTCEACDVTGSLGNCTTLASGAPPRATRTACTGAGTECAGTCNGTSANCSYPTAACGEASCPTSTTYQAAGVCNLGVCNKPAVVPCTNVCSLSAGGCSGECPPTTRRCESNSGVPQLCNAQGTWENQSACQNGFTCTAETGTCTTCTSPKMVCGGTACVDIQSDPSHCGACNHNCLGGTCSQGRCQAVAVTGTLRSSANLIGVDSTWLYFTLPNQNITHTDDAYRVEKSHVGDNGSNVFTASAQYDTPIGVIGNELFIGVDGNATLGFLVGGSNKIPLARTGSDSWLPAWRGSPNYYVQFDPDRTTHLSFSWYSQANVEVGAHSQSIIEGASDQDFWQAGDRVCWVHYDDSAPTNSGLFCSSRTAGRNDAPTQLAGGEKMWRPMMIVDVNDVSVILRDYTWYYRVALPNGNGTNPPQDLDIVEGMHRTVTEDSSGFYWSGDDGDIKRCAPGSCSATTTILATGQSTDEHPLWGFYQDATALYWSNTSTNQIMRVAK